MTTGFFQTMILSMASAAALEFTHTHRPPRTGLTHRVVASSKTTVRRETFSRAIVLRAALAQCGLICLPQCGLADGTELEEATFSAGDPRFMQKSFDELKYLGVRRSEVGMLGDVPAIRVSFDSRKVTYQRVLGNFWRSCDPTKEEQFGQPGPTIVWVASEPQRKLAEESRRRLQLSTEYRSPTFGPMFKGRPVLTEIRALTGEWMASAEQQDFYLRDAKAYEAACKKTGRTKWFVEEFQPVTVTACQKEKQGSGGEGIVCGFVYFPCNEENGCSAVTKGEF